MDSSKFIECNFCIDYHLLFYCQYFKILILKYSLLILFVRSAAFPEDHILFFRA